MKVLNIVESAYRGTLEEQDDTILWLTAAMKGANANVDVLLRGNAVNYAVKGQNAAGLKFGAAAQTQPPAISEDLAKLKAKGVQVYVVEDALRERGISNEELIGGTALVSRAGMAKLFGEYDQVWQW